MFADLWFYEVSWEEREETRASENPGPRQHLEVGPVAGTVAQGLAHSTCSTNLCHQVNQSQ